MYQKKEHFNLFPAMDISTDAQHLLTAWIVAGAGNSLISMGARCSSKVGAVALKSVGLGGVLWGANELLDVTLGIDIIGGVAQAATDVWSHIKESRSEEPQQSPNPEAFNIADHEI